MNYYANHEPDQAPAAVVQVPPASRLYQLRDLFRYCALAGRRCPQWPRGQWQVLLALVRRAGHGGSRIGPSHWRTSRQWHPVIKTYWKETSHEQDGADIEDEQLIISGSP